MLRDYEILYIVRPDLDEEQLAAAVGAVGTLIDNLGGTSLKTDVWGRRRLAYEVKHLREGQYVLTDFRLDPERVPEMEATLKISETVFRHLIVRKPEESGRARKRRLAAAAPAPEPEAAPATPPAAGVEPAEATVAPEPAAEAEAETSTEAETAPVGEGE